MTGDVHERELDRIRDAYARRDAGGASPYSFANPTYQLHVQELEWRLLRTLDALAGSSVLDVGCGSGDMLQRLVELGAASGTGIDLMEERVEAGRRLYPNLDLRAGDAAELPFEDGSFDLVLQLTCLSSVLEDDVRARIGAEMWRVTRPGGAVVSYDMRPLPGLAKGALAALGLAGRVRGPASGVAPAGGSAEPMGGTPTPTGGTPTPTGGTPTATGATPTRALPAAELRRLFPAAATVREQPLSLQFGLAGLVSRSRALHAALSSVPGLRSHLLFVAAKPA
jgi:SAM-dependent methyltransferase